VDKTVPGSNFVALSFDGMRFALQDTPEGLVGTKRIDISVTDQDPQVKSRKKTTAGSEWSIPLSARGKQPEVSKARIDVLHSGSHLSVRRTADEVQFVDDNTGWPVQADTDPNKALPEGWEAAVSKAYEFVEEDMSKCQRFTDRSFATEKQARAECSAHAKWLGYMHHQNGEFYLLQAGKELFKAGLPSVTSVKAKKDRAEATAEDKEDTRLYYFNSSTGEFTYEKPECKVKCMVLHSGISGGETTYWAYVSWGSEWRHQATVCVACGRPFEDFTSCIEDGRRDGYSADEERRANFGPAWFYTANGTWRQAESAMFTSSDDVSERPDAVQIKAVPGKGARQIATGGICAQDSSVNKMGKSHSTKLPASQKLAAPASLPGFPEEFLKSL
jgi:hypothetical protein